MASTFRERIRMKYEIQGLRKHRHRHEEEAKNRHEELLKTWPSTDAVDWHY